MHRTAPAVHRAPAANDHCGARWYAVHTHPCAEEIAARHLDRQGFTTFLPFRTRTVRHARQIKKIRESYFPRYLFISLDLDRDRWRCVRSTVGVAHLLSACDRPVAVRTDVVEQLMSLTGPDGVLRPTHLLKPGQAMRVLQGPFAEQIGTLDRVSSADAVRVLLSMMDRKVSVEGSPDMFQVIG